MARGGARTAPPARRRRRGRRPGAGHRSGGRTAPAASHEGQRAQGQSTSTFSSLTASRRRLVISTRQPSAPGSKRPDLARGQAAVGAEQNQCLVPRHAGRLHNSPTCRRRREDGIVLRPHARWSGAGPPERREWAVDRALPGGCGCGRAGSGRAVRSGNSGASRCAAVAGERWVFPTPAITVDRAWDRDDIARAPSYRRRWSPPTVSSSPRGPWNAARVPWKRPHRRCCRPPSLPGGPP